MIRLKSDHANDEACEMGGTSLWRVAQDGESVEANTRDSVTVDGESVVWVIEPVLDGIPEGVVRSDSPDVRRFVAAIARAKMRIAQRQVAARDPRPPGT